MFRQRLALVGFILLLIFGTGLLVGILLPRLAGLRGQQTVYSTAALLQQVQTISQLATVQYVIEKVVVLEDVKWVAVLGESRVLLVAHGNVKAGVDLSKLGASDLTVTGKKIVLKLPPPQIFDCYLDEKKTRVVERSTGLIRSFDKDLEQTARQNAVDDIGRAARNSGILRDADERARAQLTNLFKQLGFEKVEFASH
jgi:hypothetical protein